MPQIFNTPKAPSAIGPYSQAVRAGKTLYVSGQIPLDPESMQIVAGGIVPQTTQVMQNIKSILTDAGLKITNIVKMEVYLSDLNNFAEMNGEYEEQLEGHKPARVTVEVSKLPKDSLVEISCIAVED